ATPDASPRPANSARHISMSDSVRFLASFGHGLTLRTERPRSAIDARRSEKKALVMISVGLARARSVRTSQDCQAPPQGNQARAHISNRRRADPVGPEPTQACHPGNVDAKADQERERD